MSETEYESHPAYGLVGFSRISQGGGTSLFGSSVTDHPTTVRLRVSHADMYHDLGSDHIRMRSHIVEVELSNAQFAELLTTMNMSDGVPCTIRYIGKDRIEELHTTDTRMTRIVGSFKSEMKELYEKVSGVRNAANLILNKKEALTKKDRADLNSMIFELTRWVYDSAPFASDRLIEAAEKAVVEAKAEVDSFITHVIAHAGIKALKIGLLGTGKSEE